MRGFIRIAIILVALVLALRWVIPRVALLSLSSVEGISPTYSSSTGSASTRKLRVLFIGDSYIYENNLAKMVTDIASSDPGNTTQIDTQSVTRGGAHLSELLETGDAISVINSQHWDYVVLQEQSTWYWDEEQVTKTFDAEKSFARAIRAAGATPVIYLTWIREPGSKWYQPPYVEETVDPQHMQTLLDNASILLGTSINAPVVAAGDAWGEVLKNDASLSLYQSDGSHPTPAGTYLVALMFYRFLTHNGVNEVGYQPDGVSSADNAYLHRLVDGY